MKNNLKVSVARRKFVNTMRKKYPDFSERKWAQTSYRINHPQS